MEIKTAIKILKEMKEKVEQSQLSQKEKLAQALEIAINKLNLES